MLLSVHRTDKDRRDQGRRWKVNIDASQKNLMALRKEATMLWTIFVILLVLWALGLLTGTTMGGVIHVLLVIAIIVVLIQVIQGRR
jgi:fatty acid desaturase